MAEKIIILDSGAGELWEIGKEPIINVVSAQVRLLRRELRGDNISTNYSIGGIFSNCTNIKTAGSSPTVPER